MLYLKIRVGHRRNAEKAKLLRIGVMVRPERRVLLAGARSVRVSAGALGSRPQPKADMPPARAGRQKPLQKTGARKRAATSSERCSHVILSAERCLKGPSRSYHGEGNSFRGSERWHVSREEPWNRRDPTWQPSQAKTERIRPDGRNREEPGGSPRGPKYRRGRAR